MTGNSLFQGVPAKWNAQMMIAAQVNRKEITSRDEAIRALDILLKSKLTEDELNRFGFSFNNKILEKTRPILNQLIEQFEFKEKIIGAFKQLGNGINKFSKDGKQRTQAFNLMDKLSNHSLDYFNSSVNDAMAKKVFLDACKDSIEAHAGNFKGNISLLKSLANFFIKLVNAVLPSRMNFGLFEPKQTEAQTMVKDLESALGINENTAPSSDKVKPKFHSQ